MDSKLIDCFEIDLEFIYCFQSIVQVALGNLNEWKVLKGEILRKSLNLNKVVLEMKLKYSFLIVGLVKIRD